MSGSEKAVFAALGASIGIGVYQLVTSPWGEDTRSGDDVAGGDANIPSFGDSIKSFLVAACPVKFDSAESDKAKLSNMGGQAKSSFVSNSAHVQEEDVNKVDFGR
jgi:hypothetical protein